MQEEIGTILYQTQLFHPAPADPPRHIAEPIRQASDTFVKTYLGKIRKEKTGREEGKRRGRKREREKEKVERTPRSEE